MVHYLLRWCAEGSPGRISLLQQADFFWYESERNGRVRAYGKLRGKAPAALGTRAIGKFVMYQAGVIGHVSSRFLSQPPPSCPSHVPPIFLPVPRPGTELELRAIGRFAVHQAGGIGHAFLCFRARRLGPLGPIGVLKPGICQSLKPDICRRKLRGTLRWLQY